MNHIIHDTKPFHIGSFSSSELLRELTNILEDTMPSGCQSASELHHYIEIKELNEYRLDVFRRINNVSNLKELVYKATYPTLCKIVGPDLAIQTNLNVSIQCPEDHSSLLAKHVDPRSGDSPFQYVLWIPLTDSYDSNAMHMQDPSDGCYKPLNISYGNFVIFNSNIPHGNILNKTNKTRVSVNIRVKNWFTPDNCAAPDRQFGIYYEDFVFTSATIEAFDLYKRQSSKEPCKQ
jgi:hypothetical protein